MSHNILTDKLMKYRLDKGTANSTGNWLNCQAERVMKNTKRPSWRPAIDPASQKSILGPRLTSSLMTWTIGQLSASLQTIQNWEKWLVYQRGMLPFRQVLAGWNLKKLKKKCQVLHLRKNNRLQVNELESKFAWRPLGFLYRQQVEHDSPMRPCSNESQQPPPLSKIQPVG